MKELAQNNKKRIDKSSRRCTHKKHPLDDSRGTVGELFHGVAAQVESELFQHLPVERHPVVQLEGVAVPRRVVVHFHQLRVVDAQDFSQ